MNKDLVIVGGGPAGLAAAISAYEAGVRDILIVERDVMLGGILNQCIHPGFGLFRFKEELTGPEYANRYVEKVKELGIEFMLDTMVLDISPEKVLTLSGEALGLGGGSAESEGESVGEAKGIVKIQAKAIVLAMGCRERPRGALNIPGTRPAGIFTAGTAQRLINIEGYMPGKEVVILGSGDIGLIMARRMTLEGAKVKMVCEIKEKSGGLARNIAQCLDDFDIPLLLNTTVTEIHGKDRIEGVTIAKVDGGMNPIPGTDEYVPCDTLLLSVGLIPENELSKKCGVKLEAGTNNIICDAHLMTDVDGVFCCGNVHHVHDLVDNVSKEATRAGKFAAEYLAARAAEADAGEASSSGVELDASETRKA